MSDKIDVKDGSTVKLIRHGTGWRVEVMHKDGGITGQVGPHDSFDEAVAYIKERYDVD